MPLGTPTKRRKRRHDESVAQSQLGSDDENDNEQHTPRPGLAGSKNKIPLIPPSETSDATQSTTSGTSSPIKALASLDLDSDGIETQVLSKRTPGVPQSLKTMLGKIDAIDDCTAFVPAHLKVWLRRALHLQY
jgi:hypothetical protein